MTKICFRAVCLTLPLTFPLVWSLSASANTGSISDDLLDLPLEDLLAIEVTSVSKTRQSLRDVAAAIHVISADEIRRSGARTLPDLLRQVPGVNVAQIDAHRWAVSIRGFNSYNANKLLVLRDGRSLYTPLYGGVEWEQQDIPLEDIDRIEVIRGPGGSIWGANAVNGVINIITRPAADTQGTLVSVGAGSEDQGLITLRHGGQDAEGSYYRIYGQARKRNDSVRADNGATAYDGGSTVQTGFRLDRTLNSTDNLTVQGDLYQTDNDEIADTSDPATLSRRYVYAQNDNLSANLLTNWSRESPDGSESHFKAYVDHADTTIGIVHDKRTILDAEYQYKSAPFNQQTLIWGVGYRYVTDDIKGSTTADFTDDNREDSLYNAYLQYQLGLSPTINLQLGSKVEHNDYSGYEIQPSARMTWSPTDNELFWTSVSRAVHTATRVENGVIFNRVLPPFTEGNDSPLPALMTVTGNPDTESEVLLAYEAGFRSQLTPELSLDMALFYNDYDKLSATSFGAPEFMGSYVLIPVTFKNGLSGTGRGVELALAWQASHDWRLTANYSYLDLDLHATTGETLREQGAGTAPQHQANLHSQLSLTKTLELNGNLRYVGGLSAGQVPDYLEMDLGLSWHPRPNIELNLTGRNLLNDRHPEFSEIIFGGIPSDVERSVFAQFRWFY